MNLDAIEERWREKYYDKVAELVAVEKKLEDLKGHIRNAIHVADETKCLCACCSAGDDAEWSARGAPHCLFWHLQQALDLK